MALLRTLELNSLPENLILDIFSYLPLKDVCVARRVCRSWRRIIADKMLWRHVDLRDYKLDLKKMWKMIRTHFSPCLQSLQLSGFFSPESNNLKKSSLSDAMMKHLSERCSSLKVLDLSFVNMIGVSIQNFPQSIVTLIINSAVFPTAWFADLEKPNILPKLSCLDLKSCSKINDRDLESISYKTGLTKLVLAGCYRVTPKGLLHVCEKLTNLETLDIGFTNVNALVFHKMGRNLTKLNHLNAMIVKGLCIGCIDTLSEMKSITELILTGNFTFSLRAACDCLRKMQSQLVVLGSPGYVLTERPMTKKDEIAKYFSDGM